MIPALIGALLGVLGAIGTYDAARKGPQTTTLPSALPVAVVVVLTPLVIVLLTALPTRIAARRTVAEVLQAEAA
jgi:hypothetical protein